MTFGARRTFIRLILFLTLAVLSAGSIAQAQEPVDLFANEDIATSMLAESPTFEGDLSGESLLLERIDLPGRVALDPRAAIGAELIYVQSGSASIADDLGFETVLEQGDFLALNANAHYTVQNSSDEPATLLRVRLADPSGSVDATPVGTSEMPGATPEVAGGQVTLLEVPLQSMSQEAGVLFLAEATFAPDSETGEHHHSGPIGIYVAAGELSVVSPSGIEGTIADGRGVALPVDAPLQARADAGEATMLIFGIAESAQAPFIQDTPPPTSTADTTEASGPHAEILAWIDQYETLRNACDNFALADLMYEPESREWQTQLNNPFPCFYAPASHFAIVNEPDVRISGDTATMSLAWTAELINPTSGECTVYTDRTVVTLVKTADTWRLSDVEVGRLDEKHFQNNIRQACTVLDAS